jgi:hypothetical protein
MVGESLWYKTLCKEVCYSWMKDTANNPCLFLSDTF